tara:strand:+ start:2683 stop:4107 length:1425 start_codon:yes stop_codon:yes gene_type:complete
VSQLIIPILTKPNYEDYFANSFSEAVLDALFYEKFQYSPAKGIDRANGRAFKNDAKNALAIASKKVIQKTYRFSPYLQQLRLKGRGKVPRVIAIPTIRDRMVLKQLKECLAFAFPDCVPKNIANSYVRKLAEDLRKLDPANTYVCGCDIIDFYGSINRKRLLKIINDRIDHEETLVLLHRCLATPIVPLGVNRSGYSTYTNDTGVPQGLAVSNLLAAIYLQDVDKRMALRPVSYIRYVDDVLIYGGEDDVRKAYDSMKRSLKIRNLEMHPMGSGKTYIKKLADGFSYLGYVFEKGNITVRESSIEHLLHSIAAQFSDYLHNRDRRLRNFSYLTKDRVKAIFVHELNERITGALSEGKRFGWVAYFSQITDLTLLHRLDSAVNGMFRRMNDFSGKAPGDLKRFARAYYEMKFNPSGGYVRDYDRIKTSAEKIVFLAGRGRIDPTKPLNDEEIDSIYERYKRRSLSKMLADEGIIY